MSEPSFFDRLRKRARNRYHDLRGTVPWKVVGYWNGDCPRCGEHIGIDIKENQLNMNMTARCGACESEIYPLIREHIDLYLEEV